ncbi:SOS response-associated peptidase family protein [Pedobacter cryoconitis]|uniref:SOS response-associated peptidase family protein n=1 Tax=Pedobacter cryoconitis TaxID=188932 RepID=UPI00160F8793|nr:SOS response-associated peptidase family protein [Pedobacter cryoconitis]MBB5643983.1 putative SOS response-associated peptidase YedK [Pedobacter cryoconitis]
MCGRTVFAGSDSIIKELGVIYKDEPRSVNLNAPPGAYVPVLTSEKPDELQYYLWSVLAKYNETGKPDPKVRTFNARSDKLFTSSMWSKLIDRQTCVFNTTGFYEWQKLEKDNPKTPKQIHFIKEQGKNLTFMAGIYDVWLNRSTGELVPNCAMITHDANKYMLNIHDRMPAFIEWTKVKYWLDLSLPATEKLKLIDPVNDDFLESFKMKSVGNLEEFQKISLFCD